MSEKWGSLPVDYVPPPDIEAVEVPRVRVPLPLGRSHVFECQVCGTSTELTPMDFGFTLGYERRVPGRFRRCC